MPGARAAARSARRAPTSRPAEGTAERPYTLPVPPRFDAENLVLELSVGDVIEASGARNLGFGQRGGYERMWLGQAIHSRYQEDARESDSSYRREV